MDQLAALADQIATHPTTISDDDLDKIEAGIRPVASAIVGRRGLDRWR
jgi:hypothetical protein